jgi:hypothetical protein
VEGDVMLVTNERDSGKKLNYRPDRATQYFDALSGAPREWWLEPIAPLEEADSRKFVLRVWPLPDAAYTLRIPVGLFPTAFTIEDFFLTRSLSFAPLESSLFTAMAKGAFLNASSHASEKLNAQGLANAADSARTQMQGLQRPLSTQSTFFGTPHGY